MSEVENWWSCNKLREDLNRMPPPILSWKKLYKASVARFNYLKFSGNSFSYLDGVPFARSSADRVLTLLKVLDELAGQYDENGSRTSEGHRLYSKYFTGTKALFSDSSESEKHRFRKQLTFKHPDYPEKKLFCSWHGKESHLLLRIHFSWPEKAGEPIYVVYVGPKITKL